MPVSLVIDGNELDNSGMTNEESRPNSESNLKQKLFEALQLSIGRETHESVARNSEAPLRRDTSNPLERQSSKSPASGGALPAEEDKEHLPEALREARGRLAMELKQLEDQQNTFQGDERIKTDFNATLSTRGVVPNERPEMIPPAGVPSSSSLPHQMNHVNLESVNLGGSMADLSGYKDLSKAPISFGDEDSPMSSLAPDSGYDRMPHHLTGYQHMSAPQQQMAAPQHQQQQQHHFIQDAASQDVDTEFSGNVKTLIRLVNELPDGVTKQTGAQIIRLTMEAMGISMEDVLSEAQSAQSEMLDSVRANIKKIEEYKTVIRKLETDIKYYQGRANELSEIIDLFILSNTSPSNKMSAPDDLTH